MITLLRYSKLDFISYCLHILTILFYHRKINIETFTWLDSLRNR